MDKIEAQFESYKKKVIPQEASETQIRETRLAFYAGAAAMLGIVHEIGSAPVEELEGVQALLETAQELQRFCESIVKGEPDAGNQNA